MTETDIQARLNSENNVLVKLGKGHGLGGNRTNHVNAGREGVQNLSPFMREIIAAAATMDTAANVSRSLGVSKAHAHNLKHGYVDRSKGKDPELVAKTRKTLDAVHDKAADLVMDCLGLVTPDKLRSMDKPKDIVAVAKDLASIAEKSAPPEQKNQGNTLQIQIYAPGQMKLEDFDVIDVEAKEID